MWLWPLTLLGLHLSLPGPSVTLMQWPLMAWMSANSIQQHLDKALYICCYLNGTHDYSLVFNESSENGLITCTDSDWAGSSEDSKSTTRFYIKLANGVFLWHSHQQKTVALSSTEAEHMALSDCSCQVIWIRNMFGEIGFNLQWPLKLLQCLTLMWCTLHTTNTRGNFTSLWWGQTM